MVTRGQVKQLKTNHLKCEGLISWKSAIRFGSRCEWQWRNWLRRGGRWGQCQCPALTKITESACASTVTKALSCRVRRPVEKSCRCRWWWRRRWRWQKSPGSLQSSFLCELACFIGSERAFWVHSQIQTAKDRSWNTNKTFHPWLHPRSRRGWCFPQDAKTWWSKRRSGYHCARWTCT